MAVINILLSCVSSKIVVNKIIELENCCCGRFVWQITQSIHVPMIKQLDIINEIEISSWIIRCKDIDKVIYIAK